MFCAILLSSSLLFQQAHPSLEHPLTLSELVEIALSNNPDTKNSWWKVKRATSCVDLAKAAYFPKLDLQLGATHGKEYEFINGPNKTFTQTNADLTLSMILFDFGERSSDVDARKSALKAACWEQDFTIQKVMIDTLELAYKVLHAQETLKAAEITRDDAQKMLHYAEDLEKAGFAPISDVYTSRATFSEVQMELAECKSELDIYKGMLACQLGYSADTNMSLAPLSNLASPKAEDTKTLILRATEQRKDLMARSARHQETMHELEKAKAAPLPKLSAGATGGYAHYHHDHTKSGNYAVSLTLDIPIFSGLDSIYNKRMAAADVKISLAELHNLELEIAQEVLSANRSHEAAASMLVFAQDNKENAYHAYVGALEKYRAGKENMFQEVSSSLRQLAHARVRYSEVRTSWLTTLARLAYATGTLALPDEKL
jgi:outer membrane protein TolC